MKKKNGFISISIIYSFFLAFLLLLVLIMSSYVNKRLTLKVYKDDVKKKFGDKSPSAITGDYNFARYIAYLSEDPASGVSEESFGYQGTNYLSGYRYYGANPNNYILFNCTTSDPSQMNSSTCERWRIIGIFDDKTHGRTGELMAKIVRTDSIGNIIFDYKASGLGNSSSSNGTSDWSESQLMMMLNPTSYLGTGRNRNNSLIRNLTVSGNDVYSSSRKVYSNMGSYYNGYATYLPASTTTSGYNGSSTSVSYRKLRTEAQYNSNTQSQATNLISEATWFYGSSRTYSTDSTGLAKNWYIYERGTESYSTSRSIKWVGKVGLPTVSDFAFATGGGSTTSRNVCLSRSLSSWNSYTDCINNNWLIKGSTCAWTIVPRIDVSDYMQVMCPTSSGSAFLSSYYASSSLVTYPTVYLKQSTVLVKGKGTLSDPYIVK